MSHFSILLIIGAYVSLILLISYFVGRKSSSNATFFVADRRSPWWAVAIGMVGSSMSGVSFVSVPGMVQTVDFTYMQTVFGFFFGYLVVAYVLLPLYYRLNLTTIYTYLNQRFGKHTYKTGAAFFFLSKIVGSAAKLYIVTLILQTLLFDAWNVPFGVTVCITVFLIWLYTFRSGIKAIVWTDVLQTAVLIVALIIIIVQTFVRLDMNVGELTSALIDSEHTRIFLFDDWHSKQNFFKQFFSGIFIVIVMTGLDQDMMQKNLTCRTLPKARKNMIWCGAAFTPVNFLFLLLGAMLMLLASQNGISLPSSPDGMLPFFATHYLGKTALILFLIGIIAAALNSADSALTALTTSFSIDILGMKQEETQQAERTRKIVHIGVCLVFVVVILAFRAINDKSIIDAIYTIVSYTYGPLLGMYAYGLLTKRATNDKFVPYIAVASPIVCYMLNIVSVHYWQYAFGYELLMLNGLLTFAGMMIGSKFRVQSSRL